AWECTTTWFAAKRFVETSIVAKASTKDLDNTFIEVLGFGK
ncbi:MAG: hypothetical protein ACI92G_003280, partial [Candidatus Pelagisphaera sp.]